MYSAVDIGERCDGYGPRRAPWSALEPLRPCVPSIADSGACRSGPPAVGLSWPLPEGLDDDGQTVLVTGATGSGKSYLACAFGHQACRLGISTRYYRVSRLLDELTLARGDGSYPKLIQRLARTWLLILDDWGLASLSGQLDLGRIEVTATERAEVPT